MNSIAIAILWLFSIFITWYVTQLSTLPRGNGWIEITENTKLPEFTVKVLILHHGVVKEAERQPFSSSTISSKIGWYWHTANGLTVTQDEVIFFQPLPKPYF